MLGTAGLIAFMLGGLGMVWLAVQWIFTRAFGGNDPIELHKTAALYYCLALFIIGAQFLSVGLLGEMIAAYWTRDSDTYSIAEHTAPSSVPRAAESIKPGEGA
jgi:hypothetical protein